MERQKASCCGRPVARIQRFDFDVEPTSIPAGQQLQLLDKAFKQEPWPAEPRRQQMDKRSWVQKKITSVPFWTAYGARGRHPALHELCAYEFARHYYFSAASRPFTLQCHQQQQAQPDKYRAKLTDQGVEKLAENSRAALAAGVDYCIREEGGRDWLPLGQGEHAQNLRHDWVMAKHPRPQVPVVAGAQGSKSEEEQVMRILLLFVPWVNDVADASARAPFIGHLRRPHMESWRRALSYYFMTQGFPTQEVKNLAVRLCDVYCLPRHLQQDVDLAENSDNENMEDEEVDLDDEDMLAARRGLGPLTRKTTVSCCWKPNFLSPMFSVCGSLARLTHVRGSQHHQPGLDGEEVEGQFDRTMQLFSLSEAIWVKDTPDKPNESEQPPCAPIDHALAKKAANASRKVEKASKAQLKQGMVLQPTVEQRRLTKSMLEEWLASEDVRGGTTREQHQFLELVADAVMLEHRLILPAESKRQRGDPLVWLLHGKPGTGKSHVLSKVKSLFDLCGYQQGVQYEFLAFQNTNAAQLGGKTINSACGINRQDLTSAEAIKRMATWRWLLVDEVGLVGARLLADMEQRLRAAVPEANEWKCGPDGRVRPFAGINVIFTGDFDQLPPPEGGYLADIPQYFKNPTSERIPHTMVEQGQSLFWDGSVQGVTELVQVLRCKDAWWNEAR